MRLLNRTVCILRAKEPFITWASNLPWKETPDREAFTASGHGYLLPVINHVGDEERFLRQHHRTMFDEELHCCWTGKADWPKNRDLATFRAWFEPEFVELLFDLCDDDLVIEDEGDYYDD